MRQFGRRVDEGVLIDIALSREDLAQLTGTNLYNVSRILSKWEQSGWIVSARKRVILKKSHELVALAEDALERLHAALPVAAATRAECGSCR